MAGLKSKVKGKAAAGCVPVISTDSLKHYFYALMARFGKRSGLASDSARWDWENELIQLMSKS